MSTAVKVAGFVTALAVVFGLALGAGRAFGPVTEPAVAAHAHSLEGDGAGSRQLADAAAVELPGGLMTSQNGYTLTLADSLAEAGSDTRLAFSIEGPDGRPVTDYEVEHDKRMHLIAVRRDFSGFQHVHPRLSAAGEWSTSLDLTPGQWRVFADFTASGAGALTLGADLAVAGDYRPAASAGESRVARVDGYRISLEGELSAGRDVQLTLSVSRDGEPVTDLQPYLGAYGHLVALREGDLAYLHVHPDGAPGDGTTQPGPDVVFYAAVPSAGRYHLYLDFRHGGRVHTADFTVDAGDGTGDGTGDAGDKAPSEGGASSSHSDDDHGGH